MSNIFVLPSREDNLPNVMLESFACGTPVVSFAEGGMKEHIVDKFNGFLAEEISGRSLAKCIEQAYENRNNFDPILIREYAEEYFGYKKQADAYTLIYRKLLK
jgi:glycosyltransferase involved in cell wall biosynthesis